MIKKRLTPFTFLLLIINLNLMAILLALIWGYIKGELSVKFEEHGFITTFSSLQLLACSVPCTLIYIKRKQFIWLIIAIGFVFLALDEKFLIHENLDFWIHQVLNMTETTMTDRIDDFLILLYGLVGLSLLIWKRKEFLNDKNGLILLSFGFLLMVISVVFDTITNDNTMGLRHILNGSTDMIYHVGIVSEESFKIISEAFLLAAFYAFYRNYNTK